MFTAGFVGSLGTMELIVLAVIGLLLFGRRLPEVSRSLAQGVMQFRKGLEETQADLQKAVEEAAPVETTPTAPTPTTTLPTEEELRAENTRLREQLEGRGAGTTPAINPPDDHRAPR